jgi:long-chain acyl-CoA synthetase
MMQMPAESLLSFVQNYGAEGAEIAVRQSRGYRKESWTYCRIAEEANRVAREMESRGVRKGESVLLWGENSAQWIIAFLACLISGVVVVPIDHASPEDFADRVSREVNAKLAFRSDGHPEIAGLSSISLESLCSIIARHEPSPYPSPSLSRQDTLEIIFTSGTTAEPRGVVISHGNVLANIEPLESEIRKYLRYKKLVHPIRFLNLLPLSHVFGQMLGIFIPPLLAGTVLFADSLKPAELIDTIHRGRVSVLVAVPRFIESLQREVERDEERAGRTSQFQRTFAAAEHEHFLRRWWRFRRIHSRFGWKFWAFISGGAALPSATETFWNRVGYAVIQGYGMTETTSLITLNHPFRSDRGSIGKVFPGMEVRVGENGEILVRGENVAKAYQQKGAMQSLTERDGWFRTGDIAERDESGRLYFKGRSRNVIVTSAGMNVYPEDLEKALRGQPEIRDCAVVGIPRDGDEAPAAALLLSQRDADAASAVEHANQQLAEYQKIRHWIVWPEPDFPRTPTQKPILPRIRAALQNSDNRAVAKSIAPESLASLITRITGRPIPTDSTDANLETDLQLTSLDRVELMSVLEQRYQVQLDDVQFQNAATVGQLQKLVSERPPATAQHVYPNWPQSWPMTLFRLAVYYLLSWPATYLLAAPRIRGREHLRRLRGPVLVISNHVTYLDIAWILPALPLRMRHRLATAMGGERLARMRRPAKTLSLFERFMERLRYVLVTSLFNVFPLPQQSGFLQSFHFAGDLVDRGWNILVFPEGQTTDGVIVPFRSGIGLLAAKLNIDVVPVYLDGLADLKKENRIMTHPGHVRVTIGKPVRFASTQDPHEIAAELECRIRELQPT